MSDPFSPPPPNKPAAPFWLWPHILSLEAPAVAVLWAVALGNIHGVPFWPGVLPGLALCVWAIYLADRMIDTVGMRPEQLDLRHRFYWRARPLLLMLALPLCLAALTYLGLWVVPAGLLWQSVALGMLVTLYLAVYAAAERPMLYLLLVAAVCLIALLIVHAMPVPAAFKTTASIVVAALMSLLLLRRTRRRLFAMVPKEIAGGLLFALGCTAWVRFIGTGANFLSGSYELILMAALFACNLTGISAKQREDEPALHEPGVESGHSGLLTGLGLLSGGAILAGRTGWVSARLEPIGWAAAAGFALLSLVHAQRHRLSVDAYRVLADIAVAAPALGLVVYYGQAR